MIVFYVDYYHSFIFNNLELFIYKSYNLINFLFILYNNKNQKIFPQMKINISYVKNHIHFNKFNVMKIKYQILFIKIIQDNLIQTIIFYYYKNNLNN